MEIISYLLIGVVFKIVLFSEIDLINELIVIIFDYLLIIFDRGFYVLGLFECW